MSFAILRKRTHPLILSLVEPKGCIGTSFARSFYELYPVSKW
jgi:hypothetical protein